MGRSLLHLQYIALHFSAEQPGHDPVPQTGFAPRKAEIGAPGATTL